MMLNAKGYAWWMAGALVLGCGPGAPVMPGAETGSSEATTMVLPEPTTGGPPGAASGSTGSGGSGSTGSAGSTTTGGTSTTTGTETGRDFIASDGGDRSCDNFAQDCPPGMKCSAYANDGGNTWNDTKCVPVMEDPAQVGEECFVEGSGVSGIDNCDLGAYCWDTDAENKGTCIELCTGTPRAPVCPPGFKCSVSSEAVLNLCFFSCDPLAQDCPQGDDLCIGTPSGDGFLCVLDASGEEGQAHDPCEFANSCDPGLMCLISIAAVECDPAASGCCEPFCDVEAVNMCPGVGQVCEPYYAEGMAPPGCEDVGVCAVPM